MKATGVSVPREYAVSACECLIDGGIAFSVAFRAENPMDTNSLWFTIYGEASLVFAALARGQKIERVP